MHAQQTAAILLLDASSTKSLAMVLRFQLIAELSQTTIFAQSTLVTLPQAVCSLCHLAVICAKTLVLDAHLCHATKQTLVFLRRALPLMVTATLNQLYVMTTILAPQTSVPTDPASSLPFLVTNQMHATLNNADYQMEHALQIQSLAMTTIFAPMTSAMLLKE
jgi:hypothetical protein